MEYKKGEARTQINSTVYVYVHTYCTCIHVCHHVTDGNRSRCHPFKGKININFNNLIQIPWVAMELCVLETGGKGYLKHTLDKSGPIYLKYAKLGERLLNQDFAVLSFILSTTDNSAYMTLSWKKISRVGSGKYLVWTRPGYSRATEHIGKLRSQNMVKTTIWLPRKFCGHVFIYITRSQARFEWVVTLASYIKYFPNI